MDNVPQALTLVNRARLAILKHRVRSGHPLPHIYMHTLKYLDGLALRLQHFVAPTVRVGGER